MGHADLHIHSRVGDGMATVGEIFDYVEFQTDLDLIAVTEHDTLLAAEEARVRCANGRYRFDVISGLEVTTLDGHLLALFIEEPVASFRRIEETLAAVHRAGGLAIVPHPLSRLTRSVGTRVFERVEGIGGNDGVYFDAIEEVNQSPAGRISSNRAARLNRERLHLAAVGNSDAHFLPSIGSGRTRFTGSTGEDLRRAIAERATEPVAGVRPRLRELGYRSVALQQWRGMMATPRAMGWGPTVRSFIVSHFHGRGRTALGRHRSTRRAARGESTGTTAGGDGERT
jgi:predicted metal-dependent phosphoesterase TrpH